MPRDEVYLLDILNAGRLIRQFTRNMSWEAFQQDIKTQDAVIRRIEIIGEVTRRLTDDFKASHPEIAWHMMAGMRNRLIHEYDQVDLDLVWVVVQEDIPALLEQIEPLVPPEEK